MRIVMVTEPKDIMTKELSLDGGLGFRVNRLARTMRRTWSDDLSTLDLTPPQAAVLRGIVERPGCSLRSLARQLGSDPMSTKRCADDLESRGLIRSGTLPDDRRPRTLTATDSGRVLAEAVRLRVRLQEVRFNELLNLEERAQFEHALSRLEAGLPIGGSPVQLHQRQSGAMNSWTSERSTSSELTDVLSEGAVMKPTVRGSSIEGARWDQRYRDHPWPTDPDESLVELVAPLASGSALDLGCGTGRNSLWLARQGWRVTGVDGSLVGLEKAHELALESGVELTLVVDDLINYRPEPLSFDLVVMANIHVVPDARPALFSSAAFAVAPGGHLFVIGHHVESLGRSGPPDPERLFTVERLGELVPSLRIDLLERRERRSADGDESLVDVVLWATNTTGKETGQ